MCACSAFNWGWNRNERYGSEMGHSLLGVTAETEAHEERVDPDLPQFPGEPRITSHMRLSSGALVSQTDVVGVGIRRDHSHSVFDVGHSRSSGVS